MKLFIFRTIYSAHHIKIVSIANKVKAVVNLRNKKSTFNPSLAQRRKNSRVMGSIVRVPAGGFGAAGTWRGALTAALQREGVLVKA